MLVFQQVRVGRFRLYHAATRDTVGVISEAWRRGTLGKMFLVRPMATQLLGEEVLDSSGRIIAVFGLAVTDAFRPNLQAQRDYQDKLRTLLDQL